MCQMLVHSHHCRLMEHLHKKLPPLASTPGVWQLPPTVLDLPQRARPRHLTPVPVNRRIETPRLRQPRLKLEPRERMVLCISLRCSLGLVGSSLAIAITTRLNCCSVNRHSQDIHLISGPRRRRTCQSHLLVVC